MKRNYLFYTFVAGTIALPLCLAFAQDEGKGEKGKGKGKGGAGMSSKGGRPSGPGFQPPQPPKFADIDTDQSGDVNKEEWITFQVKMAKERAERAFGFMAGDDGKLTEAELQKMMDRRGGPGGPGGSGREMSGKGKGGKGAPGGGSEAGGGTKPKRPEIE